MARIPLYTGRGVAPSTQLSAAPSVNYSDIRTFDAKAFSAIGTEIENLFNEFNDKRVKTQVANADAEAMFQLTQLQERVKSVDPSQADAVYQQGAQEVYQNITPQMDPAALAKFHPTWVKLQAIGRVNMFKDGITRGKSMMIADDNAAFEKSSDSLVVGSPSVQYDMAIEQTKNSLFELRGARALTNQESETLIANRTDSIRQIQVLNRLNADLAKNPNALKQLKNDLEDKKSFEGLDGDNRARLLSQTQTKIEKVEREQKQTASANSNKAEQNIKKELKINSTAGAPTPRTYKYATPEHIKKNVLPERQAEIVALVKDAKTFIHEFLPKLQTASNTELESMQDILIKEAANLTGSLAQQEQDIKQRDAFARLVESEIIGRQQKSKASVKKIDAELKLETARPVGSEGESKRLTEQWVRKNVAPADQEDVSTRIDDMKSHRKDLAKLLTASLEERAEILARAKKEAAKSSGNAKLDLQNLRQYNKLEKDAAEIKNEAIKTSEQAKQQIKNLIQIETARPSGEGAGPEEVELTRKFVLEKVVKEDQKTYLELIKDSKEHRKRVDNLKNLSNKELIKILKTAKNEASEKTGSVERDRQNINQHKSLRSFVTSEIEVREKKSQEASKKISTELDLQLNRLALTGEAGEASQILSEQFIRDNIVEGRQESVLALVQDAKSDIEKLKTIRTASNAELAATLKQYREDVKPTGSQVLDKMNQQQLNTFSKWYETERKARDKNSGSVVQRATNVREAFDKFSASLNSSDPEEKQRAWQSYKFLAREEFNRLNIPSARQKFLSEAQADRFADTVSEAEPDVVAKIVEDIFVATGRSDGSRIISEIFTKEKVSKNYRALGAITNARDRRDAVKILQQGGIKTIIPDQKEVKELENTVLREFRNKFPYMGVSSAISTGVLRDGVELVAVKHIAGGMRINDAVKAAMSSVAQYQVVNRNQLKGIVSAPGNDSVVDALRTERGLKLWLQNQTELKFHRTVTASIPSAVPNEERNNVARQSLISTGVWRLSADGKTAELVDQTGDESIYTADNKKIVVNVSDAIQAFKDENAEPSGVIREGRFSSYGVLGIAPIDPNSLRDLYDEERD